MIKVAVTIRQRGSIDEVEEQEELMTVQQAELIQQYRNDFFRQFTNYEKFRMRIYRSCQESYIKSMINLSCYCLY